MTQNYSLKPLLKELIRGQYCFVAFSKPGDQEVNILIQLGGEIQYLDISNLSGEEGFAVQAFDPEKKGLFIRADLDVRFQNEEQLLSIDLPKPEAYSNTREVSIPEAIEKENYLKKLEELISEIRRGKAEKVVLSRSLKTACPDIHLDELFHVALNTQKDAFVYILSLPWNETWIGASPEKLLSARENIYETMALAGTREKKEESTNWDNKAIEEQDFVSRRIEECFSSLDLEYTAEGPETISAGKWIEHLVTRYKATRINEKDSALLGKLHPTPAVCGTPLESSLKWIKEHEGYDRSYYSGYLGPLYGQRGFDLYVNLRCAMISDDKAYVYVGGGITADSEPMAEWHETEIKSRTVLDLFETSSIYS